MERGLDRRGLLRHLLLDPQPVRLEQDRRRRRARAGLHQRGAHHPVGAEPQPVPRTDGPVVVPALRLVHQVLEHLLRHRALHRHAGGVRAALHQARRRLSAMAQLARGNDCPGDHRLRLVPAHAATPARRGVSHSGRDRGGDRDPHQLRGRLHTERPSTRRRLGIRGHPGRLRRPVVVRLRDHGIDLESVRRHAEPAHRLVDMVRDCDLAASAAQVGQSPRLAVPRRHTVLHRGDGQPLLARRGGRTRRVRGRLADRVGAAPMEPGSSRPSPRRAGRQRHRPTTSA